MLNIFLSVIANLVLVLEDCDLWTPTVNNLDWSKVGISALTCLLSQESV